MEQATEALQIIVTSNVTIHVKPIACSLLLKQLKTAANFAGQIQYITEDCQEFSHRLQA
jgi:hypothetical protein